MTKEQLMQFIEVDSEEDKDDCEFYLDVKGVEIHRAIMEYLQFDFLEILLFFMITFLNLLAENIKFCLRFRVYSKYDSVFCRFKRLS